MNPLEEYPLFTGLPEAALAQLGACVTKRAYGKGVYLYHPGSPARHVYLLESGLVRLFFTNQRGQEHMLELLGPHTLIGIPMLQETQLRLLGAETLQASVVLALPTPILGQCAQQFPQLMLNIHLSMDNTLRRFISFTQTMVTLHVTARLALLLLYLSQVPGLQDGEASFHSPISQAEMAGWVGASRVHLNRALGRLQKLGLLQIDGQHFTILDRGGLQRMGEDTLPG